MRTKHLLALTSFVLSALLLSPRMGSAQGFAKGSMLLGPHIGLAAFGSAPAFGANFEVAVTEPGKAGPGIIGVSGRFDYFGFDDGFATYTWTAFGVFANYHFAMDAKMWDPFVGLGLGYQNVSFKWKGDENSLFGSAWGSGVYFAGNAGVRYYFSPNLAARAQLGFGITYLVVGVDFGL
jgi:hypothetical protein